VTARKYTDRDLARALQTAVVGDIVNFAVEDLAEVYMDERERFAKIAEDFAREQRLRGFEVRARSAEDIAERIRADRGGL
jgi:hypothetical protein